MQSLLQRAACLFWAFTLILSLNGMPLAASAAAQRDACVSTCADCSDMASVACAACAGACLNLIGKAARDGLAFATAAKLAAPADDTASGLEPLPPEPPPRG